MLVATIRDVQIGVRRRRDARMPETLRDVIQVDASLQKHRGMGMAERMEMTHNAVFLQPAIDVQNLPARAWMTILPRADEV